MFNGWGGSVDAGVTLGGIASSFNPTSFSSSSFFFSLSFSSAFFRHSKGSRDLENLFSRICWTMEVVRSMSDSSSSSLATFMPRPPRWVSVLEEEKMREERSRELLWSIGLIRVRNDSCLESTTSPEASLDDGISTSTPTSLSRSFSLALSRSMVLLSAPSFLVLWGMKGLPYRGGRISGLGLEGTFGGSLASKRDTDPSLAYGFPSDSGSWKASGPKGCGSPSSPVSS